MTDDLRGHSLLAVFAHPDDESLACGGLLAWCADHGAAVSLLCVTHGEGGPGPAGAPPDLLRMTRATELRAAARVLGIGRVILLDHPDGMLPWVEPDVLEADIRDAIRATQPDVVITFGEDGLYWHPDHVAVHERTTAVVAALRGTAPAAPALYYVTMPFGAMRAVVDHAASVVTTRAGENDVNLSVFGIDDADAFGDAASPPTLVVDASPYAVRKLAAIKCHRTQASVFDLLGDEEAGRFLGIEHFRRADADSTRDAFIERFKAVP